MNKYIKPFGIFNKLNESEDKNYSFLKLSRLESDCEYFLNRGKGNIRHLYYDTVEEHIAEMKRLWNSFPADAKPEWLSYEEIENYEKEMLNYGKQSESLVDITDDELQDSAEMGNIVGKFNRDMNRSEELKDDAIDLFNDYKENGGGNEKISAEKNDTLFDTGASAEDVIYDHMMNFLIGNEWYETYDADDTDILKNLLKDEIRKAL